MQHACSYLAGMAVIGIGAPCLAGEFYQGYAYAPADHRLLYRESHWLYTEDGVEHRLVVYSCPDGQPFVRKQVNSAPGAATPDVELFDARGGYREGVRTRDGRRAPLGAPLNAVIDAGFDAFIRSHWNALSGAPVSPVALLVPSELRYLNFTVRMLRDEDSGDGAVRWFRLQLADWYGFALPHIELAYDKKTHELRQYSGVSNIRDAEGRNLSVTIRFPRSERRDDVKSAEIERAAGQPLTGRCVLQ